MRDLSVLTDDELYEERARVERDIGDCLATIRKKGNELDQLKRVNDLIRREYARRAGDRNGV